MEQRNLSGLTLLPIVNVKHVFYPAIQSDLKNIIAAISIPIFLIEIVVFFYLGIYQDARKIFIDQRFQGNNMIVFVEFLIEQIKLLKRTRTVASGEVYDH